MWGGDTPGAGGEGSGFRFNFGGDPDASVSSAVPADVATSLASPIPGVEVFDSDVPDPTPGWIPETVLVGTISIVKGASSGARYATVTDAVPDLDEASRSDLVKGKYEGGAKLWECAMDLARFLVREETISGSTRVRGKRVLELGCGHGVPGIACALLGAKEVTFADYNPDVLRSLTVPNVRANSKVCAAGGASGRAIAFRYLGGDWGSLLDSPRAFLGEPHAFDVVLAAETVYEPSSFGKHVEILKYSLASNARRKDGDGSFGDSSASAPFALIAAKSYYFGVGGGARSFREALRKDGGFRVETVETFSDGNSNVREILKVSRR